MKVRDWDKQFNQVEQTIEKLVVWRKEQLGREQQNIYKTRAKLLGLQNILERQINYILKFDLRQDLLNEREKALFNWIKELVLKIDGVFRDYSQIAKTKMWVSMVSFRCLASDKVETDCHKITAEGILEEEEKLLNLENDLSRKLEQLSSTKLKEKQAYQALLVAKTNKEAAGSLQLEPFAREKLLQKEELKKLENLLLLTGFKLKVAAAKDINKENRKLQKMALLLDKQGRRKKNLANRSRKAYSPKGKIPIGTLDERESGLYPDLF